MKINREALKSAARFVAFSALAAGLAAASASLPGLGLDGIAAAVAGTLLAAALKYLEANKVRQV